MQFNLFLLSLIGLMTINFCRNESGKSQQLTTLFSPVTFIRWRSGYIKIIRLNRMSFTIPFCRDAIPTRPLPEKVMIIGYFHFCHVSVVPIFHSTDLQTGNKSDMLNENRSWKCRIPVLVPEFMRLPSNTIPSTIRFTWHYWQFAGDVGNMVVKSKDPFKGWSEVYKLKFNE